MAATLGSHNRANLRETLRDGSRNAVNDLSALRPLAEQLSSIAETLLAGDFSGVKQDVAADHAMPLPPQGTEERRAIFAAMAREAYAIRRDREAIFGTPDLFGEPAWDILLDLYIAHTDGKPVSVSSACIGSASPSTTGLRWLGVLSQEGFVLRKHDPDDQRRVLVELSETGLAAMDAHFLRATSA